MTAANARKLVLAGFILLAPLFAPRPQRAFSTGPDPGRTGAPGELTCATGECHGTVRLTDAARFSLIVPREYVPGRTYRIEVRHRTTDVLRLRWGFQATALTTDNQRAGAWRAIDSLTAVVEDVFPGIRRQYIQHTTAGTFPGQTGGATWTVEWTAPAAAAGPITFYAAGNQADNNDNSSGDAIFLARAVSVPGEPPPPAPVSAGRPGSLLVYPLYASSGPRSNTQNTRISLTNTSETQDVTAHLYFVDGGSGAIDHGFVRLSRQQTISFLASDLDPDTTGYLLALAVDETTGCPRQFNQLIGDAYIKLSSGMSGNLAAESFPMLEEAACGASQPFAELRLDGSQFGAAPRAVSLPSLQSAADGIETMVILNRLGGLPATALGAGLRTIYDGRGSSTEAAFSHAQPQLRTTLDASHPAGRIAWLSFRLEEEAGLVGAALRLDRRAGLSLQGRNLAHLSLARNAALRLPVFPPS